MPIFERRMKDCCIRVFFAVFLLVLFVPVLQGCSPSSAKEAAVRYIEARDSNDWEGVMRVVLPDRVRSMTQRDIDYRKQLLQKMSEGMDFNVDKMKFKIRYEGVDRAVVEIVDGIINFKSPTYPEGTLDMKKMEIRYKDPATREEHVEVLKGDDLEMMKNSFAIIDMKKYKGHWYVDVDLSAPEESY
ncbi:MAG: hypothetical protein PHP64_00730 [Actinomycetota bacterium]|nr:hypothetical protein [Actinomycetota bacterium]